MVVVAAPPTDAPRVFSPEPAQLVVSTQGAARPAEPFLLRLRGTRAKPHCVILPHPSVHRALFRSSTSGDAVVKHVDRLPFDPVLPAPPAFWFHYQRTGGTDAIANLDPTCELKGALMIGNVLLLLLSYSLHCFMPLSLAYPRTGNRGCQVECPLRRRRIRQRPFQSILIRYTLQHDRN